MARVEAPRFPRLPHLPDLSRLGDVAREGIRWIGRDYHWTKTSLAVLVGGGGAAATIGRETIEQFLSRPAIPRTMTVSPPEDKTVFIGNQEEGVKVAPATPTSESSPTPDIPKPEMRVNLLPNGPVTVDNPKGLEIAKNISVSLPFRINAQLCSEKPSEGEVSFLSSNGNRFLLQIDSKDQCQLEIHFKNQNQNTWRVPIGQVGDGFAIEFGADGKTIKVYDKDGQPIKVSIPPAPIELFKDGGIQSVQARPLKGSKFTVSTLSIEGENVTYIPATPTPDIPPTATATVHVEPTVPPSPTKAAGGPEPDKKTPPVPTRPAPPPTVEATKVPTPEVITKPFPDIVGQGFIIRNLGRNYGIVTTPANQEYVQSMWSKYWPSNGKGQTLDFSVTDIANIPGATILNPQAAENARFYYKVSLVGNTILNEIYIPQTFELNSGAVYLGSYVNGRFILFLQGYGDNIINGNIPTYLTPGYQPPPADLAAILSPARFIPTSVERIKYLEYLRSIGVIK